MLSIVQSYPGAVSSAQPAGPGRPSGTLCSVQTGPRVETAASTADADLGAALADALRRDLEGGVAFDDYSRHLYSRDASMYSIIPLGVAFPRHSDDVAAAVSAAAALGVPVVPRGAGTSLAGQTVGPGLVLDMSRHLDRIHEIDPEARTALRSEERRVGKECRTGRSRS